MDTKDILPTSHELLSASIKTDMDWWQGARNSEDGYKRGAEDALQTVQAKITSGELRVANTILRSELNDHIRRDHNIAWDAAGAAWVTHCAGCGAKIIEG